jgi:hypothetical protein
MQTRDFHAPSDADELTRELDERLVALSADAAKSAEPFASSAPVVREGLLWLLIGLALYAIAWFYASRVGGIL